MPDGHRLVQANDPCREEDLCHVLVPGSDHLLNLPKLIPKGRLGRQCEAQRRRDRNERPPWHVTVESKQRGVIFLVLIAVWCRCRPWRGLPQLIGQLHVTLHEKPHPDVS